MCRILTCCFCLAVCWVVDLGYAQEGASRYSPSARSHRQAPAIRAHRNGPPTVTYRPAPVAPRRAAPSTARPEVIELLRGAADLLDAAGEQDDAKRLRAKAVALDKKRHNLQLLDEKSTQRSELQREIEQLQRRLDEKRCQHDALAKEIAKLRRPSASQQQVLVRTQIMELSLTKLRDADFQFEGIDTQELSKSGIAAVIAAASPSSPKLSTSLHPRSGTVGAGHNEQVAYGILDKGNRVQALIAALRETGALKILAEPDLVTVSGRPASFNVGGEFPIPAPAGSDAGVTFRKFGTQIDLVALVLGDERIRLEIRPRISELDEASAVEIDGHRIPGLRVREVSTGCELENGQSLVLAGLIQQRKVADKAPPSNLATDEEEPAKEPQTERVELIVVVTPHLVKSLHPSTTDRTADRPITADR